MKGRVLGRKLLREVASVATPDTILRWYRQLVAEKYDGSDSRQPGLGRPRKEQEIRALVVRMALENVRGVLYNLGIDIGRNTVKRILLEHGIEPPLFTKEFGGILKDSGVKTLRLPARTPSGTMWFKHSDLIESTNLSAYAFRLA